MEIKCPKCGRPVLAEDANIQAAVAKCRSCGAVFGIADASGAYGWQKTAVVMPSRFKLEYEPDALRLAYSWYSAMTWFFAAFALFWNGFLITWYTQALTVKKCGGMPLAAKLLPLIHVAVGIGLAYYVIAGFLNTTLIRISRELLSVRHGPVPWPGNKDIPAYEIEQFFCEEKVHHSKNGRHNYTYEVSAVLRGGSRIKITGGFTDPAHALFVEQQAEKYLGLKDRPVAGEMRPL